MTYILTTILMLIGVLFHVMQKVRQLRVKFPELSPARVWKTFFGEEWDSLIVSFLVWLVYELWIYLSILHHYKLPAWYSMYGIWGLALVLGYCGQRVAYRYLGTAEKVLQKRADIIEQKIEDRKNEN